jgi:hypothetical protein
MRPLRLWIGFGCVALGSVWLLDAAGVLSASTVIGRWWPILLIGLGALALVGERRLAPGPTVLLAIGAVLLLRQLTTSNINGLVWGGVVCITGGWLLMDWARARNRGAGLADTQDVFAVIGGSHSRSRSHCFRHADVCAVLGGATLDLRSAVPAPGGARVDAFALFGGVELIVPTTWRVEISGVPLFGGYQDKTSGDLDHAPNAPVLEIVAIALFGGVEVKNLPMSSGFDNTVVARASSPDQADLR